jgi:hypothetical protein
MGKGHAKEKGEKETDCGFAFLRDYMIKKIIFMCYPHIVYYIILYYIMLYIIWYSIKVLNDVHRRRAVARRNRRQWRPRGLK